VTVIAFDGKTLAADKQSTSSGMISRVTKIQRIRGHLVGGSGDAPAVNEHKDWFERGADPKEFPASLRADTFPSFLLVVTPDGRLLTYENGPFPIQLEDKHYAIGSGRDYALAAMHLGRTAVEAVQVAIDLCDGCGCGIDTLELA
jgi:ATP-dependent protease HslVU (ClpYQ) peptidase subunit